MRVEVLYFEGCPTYRTAEKTLRTVLAQEAAEAVVELVAVNTDEEAQRLRFPGSPTIRVDGKDLFPVPERAGYALGCRMYATPEGLRGSPTAEMVRTSLGSWSTGDTPTIRPTCCASPPVPELPRTPFSRCPTSENTPSTHSAE